jgi:hypothetical protein
MKIKKKLKGQPIINWVTRETRLTRETWDMCHESLITK